MLLGLQLHSFVFQVKTLEVLGFVTLCSHILIGMLLVLKLSHILVVKPFNDNSAGWGTNEGPIISILAHINPNQCKLICQTYAETYGEDLLKALDKELTNDFEVHFQIRCIF